MKRLARKLYTWLGKYLGEQYSVLPRLDEELLAYAEALVEEYYRNTAMSGEFKRDRVYKALARQFPMMPKPHISLAIELVYWKLRD